MLDRIGHWGDRFRYYRLGEALRDHDALAQVQRLTIHDSLRRARRHLWDEYRRRPLTFLIYAHCPAEPEYAAPAE